MVTHSGIEAFLTICRSKSISHAAEALFVSQSSLSVRLKALETELGTVLFMRRKGQREIVLTESGREFYEIALEYEKVMNKIEKIRREHYTKLSVSSLNSLGAYILPESYELFMEKHPDVGLVIRDQELNEACKSILQGHTDLAFNTGYNVPDSIAAMPIFTEKFTLICSKNSSYPEVVSADMLKVKKEVYVEWDAGFDRFHTSVFGDSTPQLRLDIMSQLKIFVEKPEHWAIVPVSVAQGLEQVADIQRRETEFPLPQRTCYCIYSAESELEEHSVMFLKCLKEVLNRKSEVTCLLDM